MKYLKAPFTLTEYVSNITRLALGTGTIFIFTSRTQIGFSRGIGLEHERRGSLSMMIDYGLHFHIKGEGERNVVPIDFHVGQDKKCNLFIGHIGFFGD